MFLQELVFTDAETLYVESTWIGFRELGIFSQSEMNQSVALPEFRSTPISVLMTPGCKE